MQMLTILKWSNLVNQEHAQVQISLVFSYHRERLIDGCRKEALDSFFAKQALLP